MRVGAEWSIRWLEHGAGYALLLKEIFRMAHLDQARVHCAGVRQWQAPLGDAYDDLQEVGAWG